MARQDPQRQQTAQKLAIAPAFTGCPPMHGFLSQKPHEDPYHAYVAPDAHQYRRGSSAATHGPPDTSYRYPKSIDINDDGTAVQSADKRPTVNPFGPYHGEPGHGAKRSTNVTRPSHDKPARMGNGNHQHFISKQHNQKIETDITSRTIASKPAGWVAQDDTTTLVGARTQGDISQPAIGFPNRHKRI